MKRHAKIVAACASGAAVLGLTGWTAAAVLRPQAQAASVHDGSGLQVRYEVRREPAYVPPPPSETARLDVLGAQAPTTVEEGVLSAQAGEALRAFQAEDAARAASALATVRAADARIDRETAAALEDDHAPHGADVAPEPSPS